MSEIVRTSPFVTHCGINMVSVNDGCATLTMAINAEHLNNGGIVHGGALATLADSAAGAATWSVVAEDKMAVTTDFTMTCLKSTREGLLEAKAEIVHRGRRFMHAEVKLTSDEQLIAKAGVSFMVIDRA